MALYIKSNLSYLISLGRLGRNSDLSELSASSAVRSYTQTAYALLAGTRPLATPASLAQPSTMSNTSKTLKDLTAGTAGGMAQVLVGQPFDIVKVVRLMCAFTQPTLHILNHFYGC